MSFSIIIIIAIITYWHGILQKNSDDDEQWEEEWMNSIENKDYSLHSCNIKNKHNNNKQELYGTILWNNYKKLWTTYGISKTYGIC